MVIASRTGWTERYIRWVLPLTRGWAYFHAARLLDGQGMVWPEDRADESAWFDETCARVRRPRVVVGEGGLT